MRILLSNDDGYLSPGLSALANALSDLAEITVVAPEQDRSGVSNSLTLDRPLSLKRSRNGFYFVNGTPTDCVHLALTGMLDEQPHMVISGINHGANMGDDTLYSGTVAAATEGYLFGIPAMAISMATHEAVHLETGAQVARNLVLHYLENPFPAPMLLNVNVPDVPYEALGGMETTRLGKRHRAEPVIRSTNPRGQTIYWVGPAGKAQDAGDGTDFFAVAAGRVSITPLQLDLTHYGQLAEIKNWWRQ